MRESWAKKWFVGLVLSLCVCTCLGAANAQEKKPLRNEAASMRSRVASWMRRRHSSDEKQIKALEEELQQAITSKDPDKIMEFYTPGDDLYVFDLIPSERYFGADTHRKNFEDFFSTTPGPLTAEIVDIDVTSQKKMAFAHYLTHLIGTDKDGNKTELMVRVTDCLQKIDGKWLIVHEHASVPVDLINGAKPVLMSEP